MNKKVVVIGGGHGQSCILRGIKYLPEVDLSAIVTVADDGGSTGRLRRQYFIPAMGDIRNVMIAMSSEESIFKTLMDFRFTGDDADVGGHNLGNLILTALTQTHGSFMEAVSAVSKILNVKGKICPSTYQVITLYAKMEDGTIVCGESNIPDKNNHIKQVFYQTEVTASQEAIDAILEADVIIYGIGSIYTSILPNIIIPGINQALNASKANKIYYANCMSQAGETDNYSLEDHVKALTDHHAPVDTVVFANDIIPEKLLQRYAAAFSKPVSIMDNQHDYQIIKQNLLDFSDNYIRHSPDKIMHSLAEILKGIDN